MNPFRWLKRSVLGAGISEGDPVALALGPDDQRASQYDGEKGIVTDIITTHRDQTLYAVKIQGADDVIYVEDHKVERL